MRASERARCVAIPAAGFRSDPEDDTHMPLLPLPYAEIPARSLVSPRGTACVSQSPVVSVDRQFGRSRLAGGVRSSRKPGRSLLREFVSRISLVLAGRAFSLLPPACPFVRMFPVRYIYTRTKLDRIVACSKSSSRSKITTVSRCAISFPWGNEPFDRRLKRPGML